MAKKNTPGRQSKGPESIRLRKAEFPTAQRISEGEKRGIASQPMEVLQPGVRIKPSGPPKFPGFNRNSLQMEERLGKPTKAGRANFLCGSWEVPTPWRCRQEDIHYNIHCVCAEAERWVQTGHWHPPNRVLMEQEDCHPYLIAPTVLAQCKISRLFITINFYCFSLTRCLFYLTCLSGCVSF